MEGKRRLSGRKRLPPRNAEQLGGFPSEGEESDHKGETVLLKRGKVHWKRARSERAEKKTVGSRLLAQQKKRSMRTYRKGKKEKGEFPFSEHMLQRKKSTLQGEKEKNPLY